MKNGFWTGFVVACALAAALGFTPAQDTVPASVPRGGEIPGMTRAQVLALLGAPREVQTGSGTSVYGYTDSDGERVQVWFHEGVAVHVDPPGKPFGRRRKIPDQGAYLGQPVTEFIQRMGPPEKLTRGVDGGLNLAYPSGLEVHLSDGIVTWVHKGE